MGQVQAAEVEQEKVEAEKKEEEEEEILPCTRLAMSCMHACMHACICDPELATCQSQSQ